MGREGGAWGLTQTLTTTTTTTTFTRHATKRYSGARWRGLPYLGLEDADCVPDGSQVFGGDAFLQDAIKVPVGGQEQQHPAAIVPEGGGVRAARHRAVGQMPKPHRTHWGSPGLYVPWFLGGVQGQLDYGREDSVRHVLPSGQQAGHAHPL